MSDAAAPQAPSLVDMEKLNRDLQSEPPAEVTKFAPAKYRTSTNLTQLQSDIRKQVTDLQRKHAEYIADRQRKDADHTATMNQLYEDLLRNIG